MSLAAVADAPQASDGATNPFPGPQAYDRENQEYFFGRDDEVEELTSLILTSSATLLYAPSGAGKSSLLQAGVVPALEQHFDFLVLPTVHLGTVARTGTAQDAPNQFVGTVCETIGGAQGPDSELEDIGEAAARIRGGSSKRVLLVLDQFEEVFNDPCQWRQRDEFFASLTQALRDHPWLRAVIALRSDYLANLVPYEQVLPGHLAIRYQLEHLDEQQAASAITAAFEASGVPLAPQDLSALMDLLLTDPVAPHGRSQHVNAIQLQIVCRRLWQELRHREGRTNPILAPGSGFSVRDSMVQFVDGAIAQAVATTGNDEAVIRWWLENKVITLAGRRAFVLVEDEHAAGMPIRTVQALASAKLLQFEQRHGTKLIEPTHDSMVEAIRSSNQMWLRTTARRRRRTSIALFALFVLMLAAFPLLRVAPEAVLLESYGALSGQPVEERFVATSEWAAMRIDYVSASAPVEVRIYEVGADSSSDSLVTEHSVRAEDTPLSLGVDTSPGRQYRVTLAVQGAVSDSDSYSLTVRPLPVADPSSEGRTAVHTSHVGVPLERGVVTELSVSGTSLYGVSGVDVLASDLYSAWAVVVATEADAVAVLSLAPGYGGPSDVDVAWRAVRDAPAVGVGDTTAVKGEHLTYVAFTAERSDPTLGAEASCGEPVQMHLLAPEAAPAPRVDGYAAEPVPANVLPLNVAPGRHLLLLASSYGGAVNCTLTIRSFGEDPLTGFGAHDLLLRSNTSASAYVADLPVDAILVAERRDNVTVSASCRDGTVEENRDAVGHLLLYLPGDGGCAVWLTSPSPSPGAGLPVWLASAAPDSGG